MVQSWVKSEVCRRDGKATLRKHARSQAQGLLKSIERRILLHPVTHASRRLVIRTATRSSSSGLGSGTVVCHVSAPPTRAHCRHLKPFTSKQRHVPKCMSRFRFLVLPSLQLYFYTFKLTQYCLRYTCVIFKHARGKCKKRFSSHSSFPTYPKDAKHTTISCTAKRNAAFFQDASSLGTLYICSRSE